jgi:hypothetical protein
MYCTLLLDGVPLGQVELTCAPRAIGLLSPLAGYESSGFRDQARQLGLALTLLGSARIKPETVARSLAAALARLKSIQDRLSLTDLHGDHIAIVQVVVAEFPVDDVPVVVAELGEQAAPVPARLHSRERVQTEPSRPAA